MKKILWIGPVVNHDHVAKYKAVSAAANVWQIGFIRGLIENNIEVILLSYIPYPTWPKGPLWASSNSEGIHSVEIKNIYFSYLNISFIREFWISFMIFFFSIFRIGDLKNYFIFTYNPSIRHLIFAKLLRIFYNCKWFSIIADDKSFGNPDYYIFLSFDYYKRFKKNNKLFLDGGIIQREIKDKSSRESNSSAIKSLVFAGGLSNVTGIFEFIDIFKNLNSKSYVLHIYGKEDSIFFKNQKNKFGNNIISHGFVSDEELDIACKNAFAFVNPRPIDNYGSENNFPSKLLMYLSYNKPIISTKTKGLAPNYDNILLYYSDIESLKKCLSLIANKEFYESIIKNTCFFNLENSWNKKIHILINQYKIIEGGLSR